MSVAGWFALASSLSGFVVTGQLETESTKDQRLGIGNRTTEVTLPH